MPSGGCHLEGRLGFGIHGIVFAIEGNAHPGVAALKIYYAEEPYLREKQVYHGLFTLPACPRFLPCRFQIRENFSGALLFKRMPIEEHRAKSSGSAPLT
jgi:hypothetical protein